MQAQGQLLWASQGYPHPEAPHVLLLTPWGPHSSSASFPPSNQGRSSQLELASLQLPSHPASKRRLGWTEFAISNMQGEISSSRDCKLQLNNGRSHPRTCRTLLAPGPSSAQLDFLVFASSERDTWPNTESVSYSPRFVANSYYFETGSFLTIL